MSTDTTPEDAAVPLRQRSIPDQLDYLCEKLAAQIDTRTVPRDALIAMGAAVVNLGYVATVLRKQAAPLTDAQFADLRAFSNTWLAELAQHGWESRHLLLADGSELDVGRLHAALNELEQLRILTAGLQQRWGAQAEHSTSAFPARSREQAQQLADMNSRIREPGALPTPYHVVTRLEGDWQRVDSDAGEQQPEDGDRG